jgi:hypothetical protein
MVLFEYMPTTDGRNGSVVKAAVGLCMGTAMLMAPLFALMTCYRATFTFYAGLSCTYVAVNSLLQNHVRLYSPDERF